MFYLPALTNLTLADPLSHKYTLYGFYNKTWFNRLKERVEQSPFNGYVALRWRKNGVVELLLLATPQRFLNRKRAYSGVYMDIADMILKAEIQYRQDMHDYMYPTPVRDYTNSWTTTYVRPTALAHSHTQ